MLVTKAVALIEVLGLLCTWNKFIFIARWRGDTFCGGQGGECPGDVEEGKSHNTPPLQIHANDRSAQDHFPHGSLACYCVQSPTCSGSLPWAVSALVGHGHFWGMVSQMVHGPVMPVSSLIEQGLRWPRCLLGTTQCQVRLILPCNSFLSMSEHPGHVFTFGSTLLP